MICDFLRSGVSGQAILSVTLESNINVTMSSMEVENYPTGFSLKENREQLGEWEQSRV